MMIASKSGFMTRRLPYDAELEYLESTGTQWIDANFAGYTNGAEMDIVFSIDGSDDYVNGFGNNQGKASTSAIAWFYVRASARNNLQYCVNYDSTNTSVYITKATQHHLIARFGGGTLDGVAYTQSGASTQTHQDPFIIFPQSSSPVVVRLWSLKLKNNGVLVRDFIPVRKGTVGYLYDRVSGRLFGNAGTGDFVLGPDIVPVEYIESHGTEWIDTGAPLNLQHSIRCVFQETNTSTYYPGVVSGRGTLPTPAHLRAYTILSPRFDYWNGSESDPNITSRSLTRGVFLDLHTVADIENATLDVFVNGVKSGSTIPLQSGTTPSSVLLFRDLRTDKFIGRLYCFQELGGSVPVRSFRPVRVGTGSTWEGAMMDVLTRRIYRNAGTGAFTYGNDLKYPIPA